MTALLVAKVTLLITALSGLIGGVGILIGRLWGTWSDHVQAMRDIHGRLKELASEADKRAEAEEARRKLAESQLAEVLRSQKGLEAELEQVKTRLDKLLVSHTELEQQHKADLERIATLEAEVERLEEFETAVEELEGLADAARVERDIARERLAEVIELYEQAVGSKPPEKGN